MKKSHELHRWRRKCHPKRFKTPKVFDNFWFMCDEPDCTTKKRFDEIYGKYAACHKCGRKFIVKEDDWKYYHLICAPCRIIESFELDKIAPVAELADASDLKSVGSNEPCEFESHLGHQISEEKK